MLISDEIRMRFNTRVMKSDTCWMWQGHVDKDGYGIMRIGNRQTMRVHRLAWTMAHGIIPAHSLVLHRCDVPGCVRIEHLYIGSHANNAKDRESRGRGNHIVGEHCYNAKLTQSDVMEIASLYQPGITTHQQLADKFGVTQSLISNILRKKIWKHLARETNTGSCLATRARGDRAAKKITSSIAAQIRSAYIPGTISQQALGEQYGVNQRMVSNIILGKNW